MRLTTFRIAAVLLALAGVGPSDHVIAAPGPITEHQAGPHGMRYYLALPAGWKPGGSWQVLTCGGARSRTADLYTYTQAEWTALRPQD